MTQSSAPSPSPLYIFTTSQAPLAARYPRPAKPSLIVPPLIHRSLHQALDPSPPSLAQSSDGGLIIPHPDLLRKQDPAVEGETEVTLKIHLVGDASASERNRWVDDALALLDTHLGIKGADTLLVGFKGVDYKGKKTVEDKNDTASSTSASTTHLNGHGNGTPDTVPASEYTVSPVVEEHIVEFWKRLVPALGSRVKRVGAMYLPLGVLKRLRSLDTAGKAALAVNSLDTPDCHHLPKDFTGWARENEVQLWAGGGGEGSDPLPAPELQNILQEFASHLPSASTSPLSQLIPLNKEGQWDETARRGVGVRWVLGYTVVSSSRNVVEDKGYVVAADLLV